MSTSPFADWDGTAQQARVMQQALAERVILRDDFATPRLIAGVDVGFEEQGTVTLAAAVLLDARSLQPVAHSVARIPTCMPYVPGLLSFRELPAVLQALRELPHAPDLIYCDGLGIAHPRRLGIASHLGVATGLPTIGVAKKVLIGRHDELPPDKGARVPLEHAGEQVGWMLRSKDKVKPLVVSPGHRVSLLSAVELVLGCCRGYRLPEPTRLADRLASRRGEMPALVSAPDLFD